jgi:hypothetical protein
MRTRTAALLVIIVAATIVVNVHGAHQPAHPGQNGDLTPREMAMAKIAWRYFESNYQAKTGLVNSADAYPSTTMWDTASSVGAMIAAEQLGIISRQQFDDRLTALLKTLNALTLFRDELPNKVYDTRTLEETGYDDAPGEIGFSAVDIGRLLVMLKIAKTRYPAHADAIDRVVRRWSFCHCVDACGTLHGATLGTDKSVKYPQEGRLGYEAYAADGFRLWGFDTTRASKMQPVAFTDIFGVRVPYDARDPRQFGDHTWVVSEPYVLHGIELSYADARDAQFKEFADRIYRVQEQRFQRTGVLTARTEHHLDRAPYFVYDAIYSDGYPWNTLTPQGAYQPASAAVAVKGAIGLWALWKTPYTARLFDSVADAYDEHKGFYEGLYENGSGPIRAFTANNNGVVLECLLYKTQGALLPATVDAGSTPNGAAASRCPRAKCEGS